MMYTLQRKQKKQQFTPQQVEEKEEVPEEEDTPEECDDVEEAIILDDEE